MAALSQVQALGAPKLANSSAQAKCPRCGAKGSLEEYESGGRIYLKVRHHAGKKMTRSGKVVSAYRYCYLGPKDGYLHAAPLLAQPLRNLADHGYVEEVQAW